MLPCSSVLQLSNETALPHIQQNLVEPWVGAIGCCTMASIRTEVSRVALEIEGRRQDRRNAGGLCLFDVSSRSISVRIRESLLVKLVGNREKRCHAPQRDFIGVSVTIHLAITLLR